MANARFKRKNLSRVEWLDTALDTLGQMGRSRLHLDSLIKAMPVSKGSFYHHFKHKREFLDALVDYWDISQTQVVIDTINSAPADTSAEERLWLVMWTVESQNLNRHERIIRSLALEDSSLSDRITMVDHKRITTVRGLFREMGFTGTELEVRTWAFVITHSQESFMAESVPAAEREVHLRARHRFFTRP